MRKKKKIFKDYFIKNWDCVKKYDCPIFDFCNYSDGCDDKDWIHCGCYIGFKGLIKAILEIDKK